MEKTCLYDKHLALGAKMIEFSGFLMPISYTSIQEEHMRVRHDVGVFDVSHMGEIIISGEDTYAFLNEVLSQCIVFNPSKVQYALICNETGGVIDDLMVYPLEKEKAMLIVNASNIESDYRWLLAHASRYRVQINDESNKWGMLAIQGPNAAKVMENMKIDGLDLTFMTFKVLDSMIISRTGYTGEDGFEIYASNRYIEELFDALIGNKVVPIGLGARDTLRFEAGLPLYGHEMDETITPYETNLGYGVCLEKLFIGKDAIMKVKEHLPKKRVGLKLLDKGILRAGYTVYDGDHIIGSITTGYLIPGHQESVAFALIDPNYAKKGTEVTVDIRNKRLQAVVVTPRFYQKKYVKDEEK